MTSGAASAAAPPVPDSRTGKGAQTPPHPWRPTRRGLEDAALAALAPVCAAVLALGGLAVWTASGGAGSPARVAVADARLYLPAPGAAETAAFFRVTNTGGAPDTLVEVTSSAVGPGIALSRHRMTEGNAAYREPAESLPVPAGGTLDMSPLSSDVTVPVPDAARWRTGDLVPFVLRFADGEPVGTLAVVVRPGASE
ncbi:copper chaperone PCu(A)C [Streptomyces jietaisiensis]|uniref:copper chaperone PCu(A)C n=1 Tax=Streptomyces griseoaurantiacus TaxID=68213 RepID=UPI00325005A3